MLRALSHARSMQHVTCACDATRSERKWKWEESAFVASWVHKAQHGNVNNAAPNDNPRRESEQIEAPSDTLHSIQNTAFHSKHMAIVFSMPRAHHTHGSSSAFLFCARSLCTANFFYSFHPRCCTSVYNCLKYALWFWDWAHDCRLRCIHRAHRDYCDYVALFLCVRFSCFRVSGIENKQHCAVENQCSVELWLPVR